MHVELAAASTQQGRLRRGAERRRGQCAGARAARRLLLRRRRRRRVCLRGGVHVEPSARRYPSNLHLLERRQQVDVIVTPPHPRLGVAESTTTPVTPGGGVASLIDHLVFIPLLVIIGALVLLTDTTVTLVFLASAICRLDLLRPAQFLLLCRRRRLLLFLLCRRLLLLSSELPLELLLGERERQERVLVRVQHLEHAIVLRRGERRGARGDSAGSSRRGQRLLLRFLCHHRRRRWHREVHVDRRRPLSCCLERIHRRRRLLLLSSWSVLHGSVIGRGRARVSILLLHFQSLLHALPR